MRKCVKIAVTGAAGQIGYALLFRIASGAIFGDGMEVELSLLELEPAMGSLRGVVMELEDCAFPLLKSVCISSDAAVAFADADWAVLVGAVPRKPGMERGDLLKVNAGVFVQQGRALEASARRSCRVLVVGNPCNTNAWIVKECARTLDPRNIFAMTMLDQNRAKALLAARAGVAVSQVKRMGIWGNHSATQFPDFGNATISGRPVTEVIPDHAWLDGDFVGSVQQRGAAVLKARGLSSAASAANAVVDTVRALVSPTVAGDWESVAVVSDGSYGVPEGIVSGFPVVSDGSCWRLVQGLKHDEVARKRISATLDELVKERDQVKDLVR